MGKQRVTPEGVLESTIADREVLGCTRRGHLNGQGQRLHLSNTVNGLPWRHGLAPWSAVDRRRDFRNVIHPALP
jgi:hypothetical protein